MLQPPATVLGDSAIPIPSFCQCCQESTHPYQFPYITGFHVHFLSYFIAQTPTNKFREAEKIKKKRQKQSVWVSQSVKCEEE
ncbi:unnamed protein product [Lactuca virosa]|uniref:Uncharacterized protein n=1 Tax=Lactuca virosa TaxID=75947 RepID=A0AAU9PPE4_9ASTR|nr:unnamed protein product [Lactuca virosa]